MSQLIDEDKPAVPAGTVYLSAADRQSESFVEDDRWQEVYESSLINNLLFERKIAVPDIFLFISRGQSFHIGSALEKGRRSLLDAAIELGHAVTPFRDPSCQTYDDALTAIRDSGIQGLLPSDVCERIAQRLDIARENGMESQTYNSTYWPKQNLGLAFEKRLSTFFDPDGDPETDDAPTNNPRVVNLWAATSDWRKLYFQRTRERGDGQFRRGHYLTELGRSVGLTDDVHDVRELFSAAKKFDRVNSMRAICYWLNECYQFSQAVEFKAIPNISNFDPDLTPATLRVLLSHAESQAEYQESRWVERTFEARLPPKEVLLRLDPMKLLSVRSETAAKDYFAALDAWRKTPHRNTAITDVERNFKTYSKEICRKAYRESVYTETFVKLRLSMVEGPSRPLIASIAASAGYGISKLPVESTPLLLLGGAAYATYIWVRDRPRLGSHTTKAFREANVGHTDKTAN